MLGGRWHYFILHALAESISLIFIHMHVEVVSFFFFFFPIVLPWQPSPGGLTAQHRFHAGKPGDDHRVVLSGIHNVK